MVVNNRVMNHSLDIPIFESCISKKVDNYILEIRSSQCIHFLEIQKSITRWHYSLLHVICKSPEINIWMAPLIKKPICVLDSAHL